MIRCFQKIIILTMFFIIFNSVILYADTKKEDVYKTIAHRGASFYAPENTIPAYEIAGALGFWGAECDISSTKDGKWVLMHDKDVRRTTNGSGLVSDLTFDNIKTINVDYGKNIDKYKNLKVPSLEEYIIVCKKYNMIPVIEIKESKTNDYNYLMEILLGNRILDKCIIISFNKDILKLISKLDKTVKLQLLINHKITMKDIKLAKEIGNCDLSTRYPNKSGINLAKKHEIAVACYVINNVKNMKKLFEEDVKFITSDCINSIFY